jgi:hypothetical protein
MQKFRKIISLTALWAFGLLVLTSIILYIVPAGRVAYWADWRLWGLTKTQWGELHINLGLLFLIAAGLHIYLNWSPILAYLKTRSRQLRIFTRDFNIAMALTALVMLGTYLELPPFSTVIDISSAIKDAGAVKYGEPPYGHAELSSLKTFAGRMGWNLSESLERLDQKGLAAGDGQLTLKEIALKYSVTPQQIYLAMQPAADDATRARLPAAPPPGIGRRTLGEIGQAYQLDIPGLIRALASEKIGATADQTIKEIAELHGTAPQDLYGLIKRLTDIH